jgi:hypothetical protein
VSSDDRLDIITTLVPSFQVQRFAIADGATLARPPQPVINATVCKPGTQRHNSH